MIRHSRRDRGLLQRRDVTPRRLSAAKRALSRERSHTPLFASHVASDQPTPEQRIDKIDGACIEAERRMRRFEASCWRQSRRRLRQLPHSLQKHIIAEWNESFCPADGCYFSSHVRKWARSAGYCVVILDGVFDSIIDIGGEFQEVNST